MRTFAAQLLEDRTARAQTGLFVSLGVNAAFAVMKLVWGWLGRSVWSGSVGCYYLVISVIRLFLARGVRKGQGTVEALRTCRLCGGLMLLLNVTMMGIIIQMVRDGQGVAYPGYLIYASAAFCFYQLIASIVQLTRWRVTHQPLISAAKRVSCAGACMAILNLQTAMFAQFGGAVEFTRRMNALTGAAVCAVTVGLSVEMMVRGGRLLRQVRAAETEAQGE